MSEDVEVDTLTTLLGALLLRRIYPQPCSIKHERVLGAVRHGASYVQVKDLLSVSSRGEGLIGGPGRAIRGSAADS